MNTSRLELGKIKIESDGCTNFDESTVYHIIARIFHPVMKTRSEVEYTFTINSNPETDESHMDAYFKEVVGFARRVRGDEEYFNMYNVEFNL